MSALEKAARVAHDYACTPFGADAPMPESWRLNEGHYRNLARAVLMAVRDCPVHGGRVSGLFEGKEESALIIWQEQIDAILAEETK